MQVDVRLCQAFLPVAGLVNRCSCWAHEFAFNLVEYAVDEASAVFGGKLFGDVDCLVDADDWGNVIAMHHLVDSQSQNVSVHLGDAVKVPVASLIRNDAVYLTELIQDSTDERVAKLPHITVLNCGRCGFGLLAPCGRLVILGDCGASLGIPKVLEFLLNGFGRIYVMLEQELNGSFAGQAAITHREESV